LLFFNIIRTIFSPDKYLILSIKNIFGFYPKNIYLYKQAFRHKSVATEIKKGMSNSNERLEYLGDTILSSIIADFLFKKFPLKDEGFLTEMRSKIVNRSQLNKLSEKLGINTFILSNQDTSNHSRTINGNAFEALIGAIYLDKGYNFTKKIITDHIINHHIDINELEKKETNFKSKLIEWSQKERKFANFKVVNETGRDYKKQFVVEVLIDNAVMGKGTGFSIKNAEQNAAEEAYKKIYIEQ
jgi:ribonuclease-3